jgi:hypothetical protein
VCVGCVESASRIMACDMWLVDAEQIGYVL